MFREHEFLRPASSSGAGAASNAEAVLSISGLLTFCAFAGFLKRPVLDLRRKPEFENATVVQPDDSLTPKLCTALWNIEGGSRKQNDLKLGPFT